MYKRMIVIYFMLFSLPEITTEEHKVIELIDTMRDMIAQADKFREGYKNGAAG